MPLVISLRKGQSVKVGGTEFVVSDIRLPAYCVLRRDDFRRFDVSNSWVFVALGVRVRLGVPRSNTSKVVSLVIDAPDFKVCRGGFLSPKPQQQPI